MKEVQTVFQQLFCDY